MIGAIQVSDARGAPTDCRADSDDLRHRATAAKTGLAARSCAARRGPASRSSLRRCAKEKTA